MALLCLATTAALAADSRSTTGARGIKTVADAPTSGGRTALVIGNGAYDEAPLRNPENDANDIASALQNLGFSVTKLVNASRRQMVEAIDGFSKQLRQGGVGLFYFAGHGAQVNGHNYLFPIFPRDKRFAELEEKDLEFETVEVDRLLRGMEDAGNGLNIIILDACRNNPIRRRTRSGGEQGLAAIQAATGSLIAYATAPNAVAYDGSGRNGIYTSYLLQTMRTPGLKVEEVFKQVRIGVTQETGDKQTPWESSSLKGDFYFIPSDGSQQVAALPPPRPAPVAPPPSRAAGKLVRAEGIAVSQGNAGAAREQAIADALRKAVQQELGSMADTDRLSRSYAQLNDQVYTRVKDYVGSPTVLDERSEGKLFKVKVETTVDTDQLRTILARLFPDGATGSRLPRIMVMISETHFGRLFSGEPAGETEVIRQLLQAGFEVVDQARVQAIRGDNDVRNALAGDTAAIQRLGKRYEADVLIIGQGRSEKAARMRELGPMVSVRAQLDARAIQIATGTVLAAGGESAPGLDTAEHVASKKALAEAGRQWVENNLSGLRGR
jgi:hypothetical protein